jgi:hypothetical protein
VIHKRVFYVLVVVKIKIKEAERISFKGKQRNKNLSGNHCLEAHALAQLLGALCCKPEGHGFIGIFIDIILPSALGLWARHSPLREMGTRDTFWGWGGG